MKKKLMISVALLAVLGAAVVGYLKNHETETYEKM